MSTSEIDKLKEKWTAKQIDMAKEVITVDQIEPIKIIAGLDISFVKESDNACVTIALLSYPDMKLVHQISKMVLMKYPYIPGFLGFREVDFFVELLKEVPNEFKPQILFIDGNGILHYRKFGSASHIGVLSGIPTIGVSKNLLYVEQFSTEYIAEEMTKIPHAKGNYFKLVGTSGFVYGACLLTSNSLKHPMYVSIGNKVSLETAVKLTLETCQFRMPEPVRQADLISRDFIRKIKIN